MEMLNAFAPLPTVAFSDVISSPVLSVTVNDTMSGAMSIVVLRFKATFTRCLEAPTACVSAR